MPEFIAANAGNIAVGALVAALAALAVRSIVRDRKNGKSSCGGNCAACHRSQCGRQDKAK